MVHSDDDGLIVPPRMAPRHVVLMPIYRDDAERSQVLPYCQSLAAELRDVPYFDGKVLVDLDDRDIRGGDKAWQHIKKGVPLRVEVGPRDIQSNSVFVGRRDRGPKEKQGIPRAEFVATVGQILDDIKMASSSEPGKCGNRSSSRSIPWPSSKPSSTPKNADKPEIHGGLALSHWADDPVRGSEAEGAEGDGSLHSL